MGTTSPSLMSTSASSPSQVEGAPLASPIYTNEYSRTRVVCWVLFIEGVILNLLVGHFFWTWKLYLIGMHLGNGLAVPLTLFVTVAFSVMAAIGGEYVAVARRDNCGHSRDDVEFSVFSATTCFVLSCLILAPIHGKIVSDFQAAQGRLDQVKMPASPQELDTMWRQGATAVTLQPQWIRRDVYGFASGPNTLLLAVTGTTMLLGQQSQTTLTPLNDLPVEDDGLIWVNQVNTGPYFYALQDFQARNPHWNASLFTAVVSTNTFKSDGDFAQAQLVNVRIAIYVCLAFSFVIMVLINKWIYSLLK